MNRERLMAGIIVIISFIILAYLFFDSVLPVLLMLPLLHPIVKIVIEERRRKRKMNIERWFKDGIQAVVFSLNVGYSVENSFREACKELKSLYGEDNYIYCLFEKISRRLSINDNIEDIMEDVAKECDIEDIYYFAEVFRYAKRSGGDLIEIIRSSIDTISEKMDIEREIDTIIAAKKMEFIIMCFVPLGIIMYLRITAGDLIRVLYTTKTGIGIMTVCFITYIAAIMLGRRIIINNTIE